MRDFQKLTPIKFQKFREENPDHYVVSYINCTAEVKAQSDLICTSSNAVSLIKKIPEDKKIIFAPDQNLGRWVQKNSGRDLKLWPGRRWTDISCNARTTDLSLSASGPAAPWKCVGTCSVGGRTFV